MPGQDSKVCFRIVLLVVCVMKLNPLIQNTHIRATLQNLFIA